jgi:crotonobetainyl-CoA:carnitine CoA-transferase CaiB-like acyl-CoA transferase
MVVEWEQPALGTVRQLGVPVKLSRTPGTVHTPAPALGEHTEEVLHEAGYTVEEVGALLASGAIAGPTQEQTQARFMG